MEVCVVNCQLHMGTWWKNIQWHIRTSHHFSFPAAKKHHNKQHCVPWQKMKGVSLHSEGAHKAVVSIACYNRQRAISSLFRHLKSIMQIGNRQSQCFHTEGMGALVYPCGFICQTWWSIFQRESNGRVCICVKWNRFPWIVSGIALMPDMLLCCMLLYVGHKKLFQRLNLTSMNLSPIWIQGCCIRRWPYCMRRVILFIN